jgi:hypothetical protein
MYVAAIAYNLKKYLPFTPGQQSGMVVALPVPDQFYFIQIYFGNSQALAQQARQVSQGFI